MELTCDTCSKKLKNYESLRPWLEKAWKCKGKKKRVVTAEDTSSSPSRKKWTLTIKAGKITFEPEAGSPRHTSFYMQNSFEDVDPELDRLMKSVQNNMRINFGHLLRPRQKKIRRKSFSSG